MSLEYEPVSTEVLKTIEGLPDHVLGKNIEIFTKESGIPEISNVKICILFMNEIRNSYYQISTLIATNSERNFTNFILKFWNLKIADFGDFTIWEECRRHILCSERNM